MLHSTKYLSYICNANNKVNNSSFLKIVLYCLQQRKQINIGIKRKQAIENKNEGKSFEKKQSHENKF